jgi:hypothetical protein
MRSFSVPRAMKRWRPPEKGPSNPRSLSFRTRFRQEIFLGTADELTAIEAYFEAGDGFLVSYFQKEPVFENFAEFLATILKFFAIGPNAAESGDFTEVSAVLQELVTGASKFLLNELAQHIFRLTQGRASTQWTL